MLLAVPHIKVIQMAIEKLKKRVWDYKNYHVLIVYSNHISISRNKLSAVKITVKHDTILYNR